MLNRKNIRLAFFASLFSFKVVTLVGALIFLIWFLLTPSEALRVCEETHSRDTCIHSLR